MTDLEGRLRVALRERAESVTEADLRLEEPPSAVATSARASRQGVRSHRAWLLPVGAAAAVAALVLAVAMIRPGADTGGPSGPPSATTTSPTRSQQSRTPSTAPPGAPVVPRAPLAVVRARASDATEHGRRFDVGRLEGWNGKPGRMVVYLRRLKVAGVPDARIASHGWRLKPRTDMPYVGISRTRYAIPVASGTRFIYNACTFRTSPDNVVLQRIPMSAAEFVSHVGYVGGFLVTLNPQGEATEIQTDGGC